MELNQVTMPAIDVEASAAFYRGLGLIEIVSSYPRYARFECPLGDATFSLHQVDTTPGAGWVIYFECPDLDETVARLKGAGVVFDQDPQDQHWLWREARLKDPAGNEVCLYHAGDNRRHPPWRLPAARDR